MEKRLVWLQVCVLQVMREKELEMESGWEERMVWEKETEKERVLGEEKEMEKGLVWEQERWMLRRSGRQRGAHRFCPLFSGG